MADPDPSHIGILGAGTMGSGIALTALYADYRVTLVDVAPEVLEQAQDYIDRYLSRKKLSDRADQIEYGQDLDQLSAAPLVIEAAPEQLELKQTLFSELDKICPPPAILATNTSTLSVSAIASATTSPERVAGMHFFNPAPVMPLVELARGTATSQAAMDHLTAVVEKLGKTAVTTRDTPGFIVNRVARPFYAEALRLLGEQIAAHETIDLLVTLGGGFRMGPFELMDLIGLDVNLAAASTMYEATYGEPRYRPHWLQRQMVESGRLGRKTDHGFYEYEKGEKRGSTPETLAIGQTSGFVLLSDGSWAPDLGKLLSQAGYTLSEAHGDLPVAAVVVNGREEGVTDVIRRYDRGLGPDTPILCQTVDITLSEVQSDTRHPERIVGMDGLFFATGQAVSLTANSITAAKIKVEVENLARSLGKIPVWIEESPAAVLPRIVCGLANEAAFAVGEGVAKLEAIDTAMVLGVNYPEGPLAWAEQLGHEKVVAVLDHLRQEYGEERYRVAPWLRKAARRNRSERF